jgi:hypothetical protein
VGPRADLDVCEKSRPHRDSIPGPSSPQPDAIPTELSRPTLLYEFKTKYKLPKNDSPIKLHCCTADTWHVICCRQVADTHTHSQPHVSSPVVGLKSLHYEQTHIVTSCAPRNGTYLSTARRQTDECETVRTGHFKKTRAQSV